jgi:chaperone BCS1
MIAGMATLYVTGVATYLFKSVPSRIWAYIKSQFTISVAVHNENELFHNVTKWLENGDKVFRCKSFTATLLHSIDAKKVVHISVGNGNHIFFHRGRPFWLSRVEKEANNTTERKESIFISTIGWYPDAIRQLLQEVVPKPKEDKETHIHHFADNYWYSQTSKVARKLDSVVLTDDNERKIREHVTQYLNSRQWYKDHRIPWRTGIILEGPPGTGKSTLSLALCGEFECNLFIANLTMLSDDKIVNMFKTLPPKSVMLIEDIDSYSVTNNRKKKKDKPKESYKAIVKIQGNKRTRDLIPETPAAIPDGEDDGDNFSLFNSLSGLLNAIDGICSTEDRILVATTNHIEKLDPALIRPGRFELILKIDDLDNETVRKMFKKFYPDFVVPENFKVKPGISPVQFQTLAIGNKKNPQALVDFCTNGDDSGNT